MEIIDELKRWLEGEHENGLDGLALLKRYARETDTRYVLYSCDDMAKDAAEVVPERMKRLVARLVGVDYEEVENRGRRAMEYRRVEGKKNEEERVVLSGVSGDEPVAIKEAKTLLGDLWKRKQELQRALYDSGTDNSKKAKEARVKMIEEQTMLSKDYDALYEAKEEYFRSGNVRTEQISAMVIKYMNARAGEEERAEPAKEGKRARELRKAKQNVKRNADAMKRYEYGSKKWKAAQAKMEEWEKKVDVLENGE